MQVQLALRVLGAQIPHADCVVEGGRDELVAGRVEGYACYGGGVAAEVPYVGVVVGREEADSVFGWSE